MEAGSSFKGYHDRSIYCVDWSKLSNKIASVGADDRICIYDAGKDATEQLQLLCKLRKVRLTLTVYPGTQKKRMLWQRVATIIW